MPHARDFISHGHLGPAWAAIASPYNEVPLFSNCFFSRISFFDTVGEAFENACTAHKKPGKPPWDYIYFHDIVPTGYKKIRERLAYHLGSPEIEAEASMLIKDTRVFEGESTLTLQLEINESIRIKNPWAELQTPSGYILETLLEQRDTSLWETILPREH